ncbi:hypothetical protein ACHAPT_000547 [Fusarium lateritium]
MTLALTYSFYPMRFSILATPYAFRNLRFRAYGDEPERFMRIAECEKLRPFVREITCDTWVGPYFEPRRNLPYRPPSSFFDALPFVALFRNLDTLHLRFDYDCGPLSEETEGFRYRVLDTVFRSLAGTWSEEGQRKTDDQVGFYHWFKYIMGKVPAEMPRSPVGLRTLTISNLGDSDDWRATKSEAFQSVLRSLDDLRLYVSTQTTGPEREFTTQSSDKFVMFSTLPRSWVQPAVANNIRVLSLYCHEEWGWYPKMDFRLIGAGGGMPNLRVLALGKFVFSHEWQIGWFGSLKLEKFYLEGCSILFHASENSEPMDHSTERYRNAKGEDIFISNDGYLARGVELPDDEEAELLQPGIRWDHLLSHWTSSMPNLRVFKMGSGRNGWGAFPQDHHATTKMMDAEDTAPTQPARQQPFIHSAFRYFDRPSPELTGRDLFRYGAGILEDYDGKLPYVYWSDERYYDYDDVWGEWGKGVDEDERLWCYGIVESSRLAAYERTRDQAALDHLLLTVKARSMASGLSHQDGED